MLDRPGELLFWRPFALFHILNLLAVLNVFGTFGLLSVHSLIPSKFSVCSMCEWDFDKFSLNNIA